MYVVIEKSYNSESYFYITHYETFEEALVHAHKSVVDRLELGLRVEDLDMGKNWVRYELHKDKDYAHFEITVDEVVLKETIAF